MTLNRRIGGSGKEGSRGGSSAADQEPNEPYGGRAQREAMLKTLALQPLVASFENYLFREAPEEFPSQADASSWLAKADAHIDALRKLAAADEDPECHVPSVVVQSWEFLLPLRQTLLGVEGGTDPSQAGGNRMRGPTAAEKRL